MGKTTLGGMFVDGALRKGNRALWMAHRRELVDQAYSTLTDELGIPKNEVCVLKGGTRNAYDFSKHVVVASTGTMLVAQELPPAQIVLFDEAHHYMAEEWFRVALPYEKSIRIGLTATPARADGQGLGDLFSELIVVATPQELIDMGRLVECDIIHPGGKMRSRELADDPVGAYLRYAAGTSALTFCIDVEHGKEVNAQYNAAGVPSAFVDGSTPKAERDRAINAFRAGHIKSLVNVFVLTEGTDLPIAQTCVLARPAANVNTYLQIGGRVMRAYPGKDRALLIDLCGSSAKHGLLEMTREFSLEGEGIRMPSDVPPLCQCPVCGMIYRPATKCPRCNSQVRKPIIINPTPLTPMEREALREERRTKTSDAEKQKHFDFLCREARARKYKHGWIANRYHGRFGEWPNGMIESDESRRAA